MREIDQVVAEVQGLTRWGILFADDNVIGNVPYFRKLFTALEPFKLKWIGEASLAGLEMNRTLKYCRGAVARPSSSASNPLAPS
jgi:hypothetical protein